VFAVTQSASFLSTSTLNGGVPAVSSASNALIPLNPVVEQNVSQMNNCAGFYVSSVTAGTIEDASKKPVFLASAAGQQQVSSENVDKKKRQKAITEGRLSISFALYDTTRPNDFDNRIRYILILCVQVRRLP